MEARREHAPKSSKNNESKKETIRQKRNQKAKTFRETRSTTGENWDRI